MLSASSGLKAQVKAGARPLVKATLTLASGAVRELTGDDLMGGTLSLTQATSQSSSFGIGSAVIGSCDLVLNNWDGRFDEYDFTGATVAVFVGYELPSGTTEWLRKGVYGTEQPESYGTTIVITALDNLRLLQRPYSDVSTAYPATLATIVRDACAACGVTLATPTFANRTYTVSARPDGSSLSCLDVISYAAQVSGNWVRCDEWGRVALGWYDQAGASLATLDALTGLSVSTDDVVVTGVRVTASDEVAADGTRGADGETSLSGAEGYVLDVSDNPLIVYGRSATVAAQLAARVLGLTFRPFTSAALGDPTLEAGDAVTLADARGRTYPTYLTSITYKLGARSAIACSAETPARNSASSYGAITKALLRNRQDIRKETTAREQAIRDLAELISDSTGLFLTEAVQEDGSTIFYLHNQPTVAESSIIWKLTASALAVSTDGGKTWPYGFSVDGEAILARIYAIGLNADYVNTGRLAVTKKQSGETVTVFEADIDSGQVVLRSLDGKNYINLLTGEVTLTSTAKVGDTTLLAALNSKVTEVDVEYRLSNSATSLTGNYTWSTVAPAWVDGAYMWQRTKTVTAAGTSYSDPTCIAGATGATGATGRGVSSVTEHYQRHTSATTAPTSWQSSVPTLTAAYPYLWNYETITYTDGTTADTDPALIGSYSQDGRGVSSVTEYYARSSSASTAPSTWYTTMRTLTATYRYLWNYETVTYTDGTTQDTTPVVIGVYGDTGATGTGVSAVVEQYYLSTSSTTQTGGSWSTAQPAWSKNHYIWTRSQVTWTDGTVTTTSPVLAKAINGANESVAALDSSLTQQEIYNRLTNNGQTQGIYLSGGYLYLNASYINTGIFTVTSGGYTLFSANKTSNTVTIGGFTVTGSALYSGKTSLTSNTSGVYISTSGISVGSGSAYTALAGGYLRGGNANDITGYVGFNNYWSPTGVYGTRLAGRGTICLLTNGTFGIGSYYNYGSNATITTGMSGTVWVVTNLSMTLPSGSKATWTNTPITFTKGLMTTQL